MTRITQAALERLVNAIQATDWDHGPEGGEIAGALIQARVAILAALPDPESERGALRHLQCVCPRKPDCALHGASEFGGGEPDVCLPHAHRGKPALPTQPDPAPQGAALLDHWRGRLGRAERSLLDVLVDVYPVELTKEELSERSGYSLTSSSFGNAVGRLRSLELVKGLRASEDLF